MHVHVFSSDENRDILQGGNASASIPVGYLHRFPALLVQATKRSQDVFGSSGNPLGQAPGIPEKDEVNRNTNADTNGET